MALRLYHVTSTNPYVNLAFEDHLFRNHQKSNSEDQIVILWKNDPSIVMGKFQNPWLECKVKRIQDLGINIVRRQSGGGCVYHDHGNLNYSFISPKYDYDKSRNANIIIESLKSLGINAFENKRHDLRLVYNDVDYKFSGCAFKETKQSALHHGTLLIDADLSLLNDLLRSKLKLEKALGVKSIPSSVINLKTISDSISIESINESVINVFSRVFNDDVEYIEISEQEICSLADLITKVEHGMSWEWVFGGTPKFTFNISDFEVTAKNARVIQVSPGQSDLIDLVIDKQYYRDKLLTKEQQRFVDSCYQVLFV